MIITDCTSEDLNFSMSGIWFYFSAPYDCVKCVADVLLYIQYVMLHKNDWQLKLEVSNNQEKKHEHERGCKCKYSRQQHVLTTATILKETTLHCQL